MEKERDREAKRERKQEIGGETAERPVARSGQASRRLRRSRGRPAADARTSGGADGGTGSAAYQAARGRIGHQVGEGRRLWGACEAAVGST
ncbi:hypothetical protein Scep_016879 [Stephania cephalantha]|uniref:Uncharacterized protein n=1 Tax=Stephania cephalantha TaxID=152367 RepID=A0AAP0IQB2_9MAGN